MFVHTNVNPNSRVKAKDDAVQAIAIANGLDWDTVYNDLCYIGGKLRRMPHEKFTYEKLLRKLGWVRTLAYKGVKGETRVTVEQFCKEKPIGTFLVRIRGRLTVVKDGKLLDTYNCLKNAVGTYWYKGKSVEQPQRNRY